MDAPLQKLMIHRDCVTSYDIFVLYFRVQPQSANSEKDGQENQNGKKRKLTAASADQTAEKKIQKKVNLHIRKIVETE